MLVREGYRKYHCHAGWCRYAMLHAACEGAHLPRQVALWRDGLAGWREPEVCDAGGLRKQQREQPRHANKGWSQQLHHQLDF